VSYDWERLVEWEGEMLDRSGVGPAARLVALLISTHAHGSPDGSCWLPMRVLEAQAGYSATTIRAAIKDLEASGYLEVRRGGGDRPNRFRVLLPDRTLATELHRRLRHLRRETT
jgi:DNA-binding MarR family transcriptional regulator